MVYIKSLQITAMIIVGFFFSFFLTGMVALPPPPVYDLNTQ